MASLSFLEPSIKILRVAVSLSQHEAARLSSFERFRFVPFLLLETLRRLGVPCEPGHWRRLCYSEGLARLGDLELFDWFRARREGP